MNYIKRPKRVAAYSESVIHKRKLQKELHIQNSDSDSDFMKTVTHKVKQEVDVSV